jgi:hypothetical protein
LHRNQTEIGPNQKIQTLPANSQAQNSARIQAFTNLRAKSYKRQKENKAKVAENSDKVQHAWNHEQT